MGHGGNVIDELTTDHREVEELFGRIEALPPGHKDRKLYADQATIELIRHSVADLSASRPLPSGPATRLRVAHCVFFLRLRPAAPCRLAVRGARYRPLSPVPSVPSGSASRSPWRSLRHRSMRWWSVANFVSNAGTWMQLTVQNLLVLQITGSAAATGLSMSVQAAPALLISVFGGAAVDRWPRKLTAAVSQALLGAVAFVTALMVALDRLDVTSLMVLAAVTGVIATVDDQRVPCWATTSSRARTCPPRSGWGPWCTSRAGSRAPRSPV
ncbi:hypothetical protein SVIOM342S_03491 [Streptomyces violaceorubidus]